jgi:methyl-accepting chemotaxis protein
MLHRLSIRERLVAAFAFLLLAFGGLGAFSVERMQSVNAAAAAISDRWLPAIQVLGQLESLMSELRLDVLNHVTSTDPARARRLEADMEQVQARLGAVRTTFAATITLPEERRLFEAVAQAQDLYTRQVPTIIGLSRDGQQAAAQTAVQQVLAPAGAEIATRMHALAEFGQQRAHAARAAAARAFEQGRLLILAGIGITLALGAAVAAVILGAIGRGITAIVVPMQRLAEGDLAADVPAIPDRTEMGRIAATLRVFKAALEEKQRADAAARQEEQAKVQRVQAIAALVKGFEEDTAEALSGVAAATTQLDAMSGSLTENARIGESRASAVAEAAELASASVQNVSAAAEQLGASIAEIARRVTDSATAAREAAEGARASDTAITGLSDSAQRIGDVVRLIADIAGQTNLLALNATIEAARAGEHGKGFAVVASEVKALAAQTAKATEQIGAQIATMQAETRGAVDAIRAITSTIGQVDNITVQVAAAAEEQASATQEIVRAVAEAATGTREVSRYTGELLQGATATGQAAAQVGASSGALTQRSVLLRQQVDRFLAGIRAA